MIDKVQSFLFGNKRRLAAIIGIVLLCSALITIGLVYASYVKSLDNKGYAVMKEFYFTSNLLDGGTHTLNPGSKDVTFTIGNHADNLRYSEVDIDYSISVKDLTDESLIVNVEESSGTISGGSVNDVNVTISDFVPGHKYEILALGEGSYHQELSAIIVVPENAPKLYYYLDKTSSDEYVVLTVWAQGYSGEVTINPPPSLIPDNTDPVMRDVTTGQISFTDTTSFVDEEGYSSHSYRFFGNGVSVEDFTVSGNPYVKTEVNRQAN